MVGFPPPLCLRFRTSSLSFNRISPLRGLSQRDIRRWHLTANQGFCASWSPRPLNYAPMLKIAFRRTSLTVEMKRISFEILRTARTLIQNEVAWKEYFEHGIQRIVFRRFPYTFSLKRLVAQHEMQIRKRRKKKMRNKSVHELLYTAVIYSWSATYAAHGTDRPWKACVYVRPNLTEDAVFGFKVVQSEMNDTNHMFICTYTCVRFIMEHKNWKAGAEGSESLQLLISQLNHRTFRKSDQIFELARRHTFPVSRLNNQWANTAAATLTLQTEAWGRGGHSP